MNAEQLDRLLESFPPVGLEDLDERAGLLRRTDTKYVLDTERFTQLLEALASDHEVLEVDRRRRFAYESVYFDTAELRCFWDHVDGRSARFKARTRLYKDTVHCTFEVKLKHQDGKTDKRQIDHPPDALESMDEAAERCLHQALSEIGIDAPEEPLRPSLDTRFERVTLAPRTGRERTTCDLALCLQRPDGAQASVRHGVVVVETKSEGGDGPTEQLLGQLGLEPVSFSKYRSGIALLVEGVEDPEARSLAADLFDVSRGR